MDNFRASASVPLLIAAILPYWMFPGKAQASPLPAFQCAVSSQAAVGVSAETTTLLPEEPSLSATFFGRAKRSTKGFHAVDFSKETLYDATCRLQFFAKNSASAASLGHCTCAFYGKHSAIAAAHCFTQSEAQVKKYGKGFELAAKITARYNSAAGDKVAKEADNAKRTTKVIEWWYPNEYPAELPKKNDKPDPGIRASGSDMVVMTTETDLEGAEPYALATPEQVQAYLDKKAKVRIFGYPVESDKGEVATTITAGPIERLTGDLDNQAEAREEQKESPMDKGASGGPWFIAKESLIDAKHERLIIGVNAYVRPVLAKMMTPLISQQLFDIAKDFADGKGAQHKDKGVYKKV